MHGEITALISVTQVARRAERPAYRVNGVLDSTDRPEFTMY